jgi:hypothetical protein
MCAVEGKVAVPVLLVGRPILDDQGSARELAFQIGWLAALLRPERFIRWILPLSRELAHLIDAAMALADETTGRSPAGELAKTTERLKHDLPAVALDSVASLGRRLRRREVAAEAAARRWLRSSDLTCARAGLVLCGDVARAARSLKEDPAPPPPGLSAQQRMIELIWSSATEPVFAAQRHLGYL